MHGHSCMTLCDSMDCSLPGSSVHGILVLVQARVLEWVAISSSRGFPPFSDQTLVSCIAGGFFTTETPGSPVSRVQVYKASLRSERRLNKKIHTYIIFSESE